MSSAVQLKNVSKKYGQNTVLDELDLNVAAGEKLCIIGPSGSGKTTILRTIMTLEKIDSGQILIDGESIYAEKVRLNRAEQSMQRKVRAHVGMVFQSFNLFPHLSVERNITLAQEFRGIPRQRARERARELLDLVGLSDKPNASPSTLSGGQKQRVAIARSLALDPKVMLFDEVTSALDPEVKQDVMDVLFEISRRIKMTMVLVTHEMHFARIFSDRVTMFDAGKIVESGPPEQIFGDPKEPRTKAFLKRMTAAGYEI